MDQEVASAGSKLATQRSQGTTYLIPYNLFALNDIEVGRNSMLDFDACFEALRMCAARHKFLHHLANFSSSNLVT